MNRDRDDPASGQDMSEDDPTPLDYESRTSQAAFSPGVSPLRAILIVALAALVIGLGLHLAMAFLHQSRERQAWARVSQRVCTERMAEIGQAIRAYANQHGGRLPDSLLAVLSDQYLGTDKALFCPAGDSSTAAGAPQSLHATTASAVIGSYRYVGRGLDLSAAGDTPILFEPDERHARGSIHVLHLDGHVTICSDPAVIQSLRQRHSAP